MDSSKATVVSILPYEIPEKKPNLYPGNFVIPAGTAKDPGILTVGKSIFWIPMAFGAPSLQAASPAFEVAESIVNDYINALLGINDDCRPGIFAIPTGFKNRNEAREALAEEIEKRIQPQNNWFIRLVNMADAEFKTHGRSESISDLQKVAARQLNLKDKPWLMNVEQLSLNNCPACYQPINVNAVICGHCKYILNPEKFTQMRFATDIPMVATEKPDVSSGLLVNP